MALCECQLTSRGQRSLNSGLNHAGENCWYNCNDTQGQCDWCGNDGWCCRKEFYGNGCDGFIGGTNQHECVKVCNNLENLVNNHRANNGLSRLPCHDKPRYFAEQHVYDLRKPSGSCSGDLHYWKSSGKTGGRPCIQADCQLMKLHLGSSFVESLLTDGPAEISADGKRSDQSRFQGWKTSTRGHNEIMLAGKFDIIGCFNDPNGDFSHCNFFELDKEHPRSAEGYTYDRPCA